MAILCILLASLALWMVSLRIGIYSLYALPIALGLIVSWFSYWNRYVADIGIFERVCHISSVSDCDKVARSSYSTLGGLSLDSIALAFFFSQTACMATAAVLGMEGMLYALYLIAAIAIIPMAAYSVYSQYRIGKICPACLAILACVAAEAALFASIPSQSYNPWLGIVCIGSMICISCLLQLLSQKLSRRKQLLNEKICLLKLKRKKEVLLLESSAINAPVTPIWFGNQKSPISLTTVISPSCGHCRKVISELLSLMERDVEFRWNLILGKMKTDDSDVIESWVRGYFSDKDAFMHKIRLWCKEKTGITTTTSKTAINDTEVQAICQGFDRQAAAMRVSGYPRIILNDRLLSSIYGAEDIEFIIADSISGYS